MSNGRGYYRGHLMVALLSLPLTACSQFGPTLASQTLQDWTGSSGVHREQARKLPYASLLTRMEGNQSLLVLAYHNGEAGGDTTLWQARDRATLTLESGRPTSTAGFNENLLSLNYGDAVKSGAYRVRAHWEDSHGVDHLTTGQASLSCQAPETVELPLVKLALERCVERVDWQGAGTSHNTLWRHRDTRRIWAGEVHPWPGARPIEWQVARPWWNE